MEIEENDGNTSAKRKHDDSDDEVDELVLEETDRTSKKPKVIQDDITYSPTSNATPTNDNNSSTLNNSFLPQVQTPTSLTSHTHTSSNSLLNTNSVSTYYDSSPRTSVNSYSSVFINTTTTTNSNVSNVTIPHLQASSSVANLVVSSNTTNGNANGRGAQTQTRGGTNANANTNTNTNTSMPNAFNNTTTANSYMNAVPVTRASGHSGLQSYSQPQSYSHSYFHPHSLIFNLSNASPPLAQVCKNEATITLTQSQPRCSWFQMDEIHPIEKRFFPEFFVSTSNSTATSAHLSANSNLAHKSPEIYKEYRNFMVNVYHQNPSQYLTYTSCIKSLSAPLHLIQRIHAFLEHWGIINSISFDPSASTSTVLSPPTSTPTSPTSPLQQLQSQLSPSSHGSTDNTISNASTSSTNSTTSTNSSANTITNDQSEDKMKEERVNSKSSVSVSLPTSTTDTSDSSLLQYVWNANGDQEIKSSDVNGVLPVTVTHTGTSRSQEDAKVNGVEATFQSPAPPKYACNVCGDPCIGASYQFEKFVPNLPLDIPPVTNSALQAINSHHNALQLCGNCFAMGNFPNSLSSTDFAKIDVPHGTEVQQWTDQETLLLLEGIDKFHDNWTAVSEHVGTKSKSQCVIQFLRLPIEDKYLEEFLLDIPSSRRGNLVTESTKHSSNAITVLPFPECDNPIMSLVTFLASMVNPGVAAAAAQAALDVFLKQRKEEHLKKTSTQNQPQDPSNSTSIHVPTGITKEHIRHAAEVALNAAITKSKILADKEEKEVLTAIAKLIEVQLKKIESKLKQFDEIEQMMDRENTQIERARQQLHTEQMQWHPTAKLSHQNVPHEQ